jgi:opacity protein-like surface antigen
MKSKVVVSLFAFLVLLSGVAQAQDHSKVDIFAGYSFDRWDGAKNFNLNGGSASVAYNVNNWLSGVADFGGYHNGNVLNTGLDFTLSTYLFGPRISYRHSNRVTPFGEVLFGAERVSTTTAAGASRSDSNFAMTVGGGFDVKLAKHFSIRPAKVDYLLTRFSAAGGNPQSQKNLRVSTGVVFNF